MPAPDQIERPWLASPPPGVPTAYAFPDVALPRLLDDAARDFPDNDAVRFGGGSLTWGRLRGLVDRAAGLLAWTARVEPGHRVLVLEDRSPATAVVQFALWRLGAVVVPIGSESRDELRRDLVEATGARVAVGPRAQASRLRSLLGEPGSGALDAVVVTDPAAWRPAPAAGPGWLRSLRGRGGAVAAAAAADGAGTSPGDGLVDLDAILQVTPAPPAAGGAGPDDVAVLRPVADPAGPVRLVPLRHRELLAAAFQCRLWLPDVRAGEERLLSVLAPEHPAALAAGLLHAALAAATLVVPDQPGAGHLLDLVERERPTLLCGEAAMFAALLEAPAAATHDVSSVRSALAATGPLDPSLVAAFEDRFAGARLRRIHAPAGAAGPTHASPLYGRAVDGAIGVPVTGTTAMVVDGDRPGAPLPAGEVGVLAVHGPQVAAGGAGVMDGWLLTDELARCDPDGVFHLVGRRATLG